MNREWLALLNPRQKGRGWVRGRGHHPQQHLKEEKQDPATHQMSGQKEKAPGIPVRGQTSVGRAMEVRKQRGNAVGTVGIGAKFSRSGRRPLRVATQGTERESRVEATCKGLGQASPEPR